METDLTKRIKALTHGYRPKIETTKRTTRWADEVWTPTGIVDSIRFEDFYKKEKYLCRVLDIDQFSERDLITTGYMHKLGVCFRDGSMEKDSKKCHGCVCRCHTWEIGMMITCFEVKITLSDFRSKNGHNFHGNENYYCVPKELAPKIANEVPEDVGILAYFEGDQQFGLRKFRPSGWRDVAEETKVYLLYNAMKKWCDGAVFV